MAKPIDTTDERVQWILRAVRNHPDCNQSEIWDMELQRRFTGYGGKGHFNYGFLERATPKLRKEGYIARGYRFRLSITPKGVGSILPLGGFVTVR